MEKFTISSGNNYFKINNRKYCHNPNIEVDYRGDSVSIIDTIKSHVIAKGDYTQFLNGDNGNVGFASVDLLSNFLDTVFDLSSDGFSVKTGWADYADTQYTTGSPFSLDVSDSKVSLPNNAGTVRDSEKPSDIPEFYNGTTILGKNGDGYSITIEFKVRPTGAGSNPRVFVSMDIGGAVGEIYPRDFTLSKGNGEEHYYLSSFSYYTLDTFEANGGTIKVQAINEDLEIYDIRYVIFRLHKSNS